MAYTILHVESSPSGDRSVSRKLAARILAELKAKHPDSKIIERDLAANPFPHLSGLAVGAFFTPPELRAICPIEANVSFRGLCTNEPSEYPAR